MKDKGMIQTYINNFRRLFSPYLKPGIGMRCIIYPAEQKGAILEFYLGPNEENNDIYLKTESSVNDALGKIKQKAFGGNLESFNFGGTNIIMEPNRIILIIGEDNSSEWSERKTKDDIGKIVNPHKERAK